MPKSRTNLIRAVIVIAGFLLAAVILVASGVIYDDLERQQQLAMRARISSLAARLASLPPDGSRSDWQMALQREDPAISRLGIYERRDLITPRPPEDDETHPQRAIVPFQTPQGTAFAEIELDDGEPQALVAEARYAAAFSAAGGVLAFALSIFSVWASGRFQAEAKAAAEVEQQSRFETMSLALAKEFAAAAGALKALPAPSPEATGIVPYEPARLDRLVSELELLSAQQSPAYAAVDSLSLVRWVQERCPDAKLTSSPGGLRFASDAKLLGEALLRLVRNAVEANPEGEVRLEFLRPTGNAVTIRVADMGPGFAPDLLPRLNEPFLTTKPAGLGLGLSVARKMINALSGKLVIEPNSGGGTVAEIRLENISTTAV